MTSPSNVFDIDSARNPLQYALRYAAIGWHVLPLLPHTKKPHGRLVRNGFHDATTDESIIRSWWASCPDAGIGIAVKASGLVAVDIDPRNGGMATIEALEAQHGDLTTDVLAYTGGGGEHRVFAAALVDGLPGKLGPGVDLKADGYIAVEPTFADQADPPHRKPYAWEASSDPLDGIIPSTLPGWIRDLARQPLQAQAIVAQDAPPIDPARLASAREALPHIDANGRDTWLQVGMSIHNELPHAEGFALWSEWSATSAKFDPQDQLRVWRSFKRRGLAGVGLNSVFAQAQAAGWKNRPTAPTAMPPLPEEPANLLLDVHQLEARSQATRWAVKGIVPEASLGMIFGGSGTFKSFIALDYCLHRAYGMDWCGRRTRPGVPVFIAAEGGTGLMRRIKAWHQQHGMDWRECTLRVVVVPMDLMLQASELADNIRALGLQPADIVIDTMSQTFTGNENAANEVAGYLRAVGSHLVAAFGCTAMVVHHSGHGATERPRGSSAILANVDFLLGVFREGDDAMTSTVECLKQKDGEKFKPMDFLLTLCELGHDADGDPITSLAASHVNNAETILQADAGKKEGHRAMLLRLVGHGIDERELRKAFYAEIDDMPQDSRQKAFVRAMKWATDNKLICRAGQYVQPAAPVDNSASEQHQEAGHA